MTFKRIIALLTALVLPVTSTSCTLRSRKQKEESSSAETSTSNSEIHTHKRSKAAEESDLTPDGQFVHEKVEQLLLDIKEPDNEEAVREGIEILADELDKLYEAYSVKEIIYYSDWNNEELEAENDEAFEAYYVAADSILYAFYRGYATEEYSALFEEYIDSVDADLLEYFTLPAVSLKRIEGYAKVDSSLMDEQLDNYYDIAYNEDLDDDEKNVKCAEVYLDVLAGLSEETFYSRYNRDYTPEEILETSNYVREYLIPLYNDLLDDLYGMKGLRKAAKASSPTEDPFETIAEYAYELSDEIGECADNAIDKGVYTLASGDDCYDGSFTTETPVSGGSLMYIYCDGSYTDLETAIHEFGHHYASTYAHTPAIKATLNLDIAEVQSQGMEILFTQFYDDIYGEYADVMEMCLLIDLLSAVISGFLVGEFEYTMLRDRDSLNVDDIIEGFNDIMEDFNPDIEFYYIPHIFEQPGYYISYGTSALAALDLLSDPDTALDRYEAFARVDSNDHGNKFRSALDECGFDDVLTEDYIEYIADVIRDRADEILDQ